jgi:hypothetical protein
MVTLLTPSQDHDLDLGKAKARMLAYAAKTGYAYRQNLKKPKPCDSGRLAGTKNETS